MPNGCSTILLNDIHTPAFEDVVQCKPNANRAPATKRRLAVVKDDHGVWWKAKRSGEWCRAQAAEGLAAQGQVVVGRVAVVVKPKVERATSEPEVGPPENPLKSALREFQRTKGCTLTHIGSLLGGCSKGTVSNWLNGVRMGDAAVLALNERVQALLARGSSAEAGAEVGPVPVREARRPLLTVEAQTAVDAAAVAKQAKETDEARAAREAREAAAKKARAAKEQAKEALAKEAREAREAKEALAKETKEAMHEARHEAAAKARAVPRRPHVPRRPPCAKAAAEAAVEEAASAQRYAAESVERLQRNDEAREQQCKAHAAQLRTLVLAGRLQDVETYVKQLIAAMPSSASRDTIRRLQDAVGPAVDALVEMAEVACEVGQGRRPITAVDADAAAAATQPQAASGTINTATAPGPAAPATDTDTDTVAVAAAPGTSTAIAGASSPAASVTVTATVTAATTQAASGTTSPAIAPGPVAPATDTDTATVAATADPELQDLLRWLLHVKLSESEYLLPRSGTLTEPSSSTAHAAALAALDTRLNRHTRVKEALRSLADVAMRADLQAAMQAAAERSGTPLEVDTYAQRAFELRAASECYPPNFGAEEEHSEAECNAVSRAIVVAFMDDPRNMQPGVAALYDRLPVEEQHEWEGRRGFLRAQRASVVTITAGDQKKAELLDRASRLQFAMLYNERLTYFGKALFHAHARSEMYPGRLLGGDVMDWITFENHVQQLLRGGMQIGDIFSINQCRLAAADTPRYSVELNLLDCHVLFSSVISLSGHLLHLTEVGALLHDLFASAFPDTFNRQLSTFSLSAATSGLRSAAVVPLHRAVVVIEGQIQLRAPLEELEEEVDGMVSQLSAPSLHSRVTSTKGGIAQSAAEANLRGGLMQQWIAGDPEGFPEDVRQVELRRIAEWSTAHRSTMAPEVQYIDHPRSLQNGAVASMAMTVRAGEIMGKRHGVQRHELPPQWRHRRELRPSAAAGPAAAAPAAMPGAAEPAMAAAGSPETT